MGDGGYVFVLGFYDDFVFQTAQIRPMAMAVVAGGLRVYGVCDGGVNNKAIFYTTLHEQS